jgi:long-chain acyl-CoA synthetase
MPRTLAASPAGLFVHDVILAACRQFDGKTALVDTSCSPARRFTYAEYGTAVEELARGFVAAGLQPGEVIAIYLPNCWEFCAAYHAATLAGAIPTPLNPSYRQREVRYQLENSGAALLITDGALIHGMDLAGLPALRAVYTTRVPSYGAELFTVLPRPLESGGPAWRPVPADAPDHALAALPYSSGTTGLPKGVMLSHTNLVANVFQVLGVEDAFVPGDIVLCALPLYHIYGLNVILNPVLTAGGTLVLMPRFDCAAFLRLLSEESVTMVPLVPPMLNALCHAAEAGQFPRHHQLHWVKCGAAPLAPELAQRFTHLTGVPVRQGYGMTETSPVTHIGVLNPYRPDSIGLPVAETECRIVDEHGNEVAPGQPGELVMRGPQFMLGYWRAPEATAAVLRDGWYWSGDLVRRDPDGFFFVLDRRKEMIKFKGFPVAPAEVESVLLEHPAVRDCGVVPRPDAASGEVPCAFVVLRPGFVPSAQLESELAAWVAGQLTSYKQPREIHFVEQIPHTPSGKILRRELRRLLAPAAEPAA